MIFTQGEVVVAFMLVEAILLHEFERDCFFAGSLLRFLLGLLSLGFMKGSTPKGFGSEGVFELVDSGIKLQM